MQTVPSQLPKLSQQVAGGETLSSQDVESALSALLDPQIPIETKAEFLTSLSARQETAQEIAEFAIQLRKIAVDPQIDLDRMGGILLDTCGTGADGSHIFNVSTASALVLAADGIPIAKHGNRSITSQCGSADVLEALGIHIEMSPERLRECIETIGIGFLFAPRYHPAFKAVQPVRQSLAKQGKRTVFNLLGPLVNPARPNLQMIGVFDPKLTELYANVLRFMKIKRAMIFHGYNQNKQPCLDELSTMGLSRLTELRSDGMIETKEIDSLSFGWKRSSLDELKGGDAKMNAQIIRDLLSGKDRTARRDILAYNAGVGFVLAEQATNLEKGVQQALEVLNSGAALAKLNAFREFSTASA